MLISKWIPLLCAKLLLTQLAANVSKPNILFILADDLGIGDVSPTNPECKIKTPHLQKMADEGITFLDAHSSSAVCTPTRYGVLTGRYNWRSRLARGVLRGTSDHLIPAERATVAHLLKKAGYHTQMIGKWHLGGMTDEQYLPNNRGFDHFYGFKGASIDSYSHKQWQPGGNMGGIDWQRNGETLDQEGYSTDLLTDEIVNTLIPQRDPAKPFFMSVAFNAVHTPLLGPDDLVAKYASIFPENGVRQIYAAMLDRMDFNIGRILDALDLAGIQERTLVFFMSDNGGDNGNGGAINSPLRGGKGDLYEGGVRVAAGLRWPGVVAGGSTSNQFISVLDVLPTVAAAVGIEVQNDQDGFPLDGRNLWKELKGEAPLTPADEYLVVGGGGSIALFDGKWKLIKEKGRGQNADQVKLFDIEQSPDEADDTDLANSNSEVVQSMSERIEEITRHVANQL